jgi:hypothetical protein
LAIVGGESRVSGARPAWPVVAMDQRGVSRSPRCGGFLVISVVTKESSRWLPVPSCMEPPGPATRASAIRDQGPVPVPPALRRVVPPDHAPVRGVRVAVCATPSRGAGRFWPFTRGRPIVRRGRRGGGSYHMGAPSNGRIHVRRVRGFWRHRAVWLGLSPRAPTQRPWRAGTQRTSPRGGTVQSDNAGACRARPLHEPRPDASRMAPAGRGITGGRAHPSTRSSLADHGGAWELGDGLLARPPHRTRRHVIKAGASPPVDQRRGDHSRGSDDPGPGA